MEDVRIERIALPATLPAKDLQFAEEILRRIRAVLIPSSGGQWFTTEGIAGCVSAGIAFPMVAVQGIHLAQVLRDLRMESPSLASTRVAPNTKFCFKIPLELPNHPADVKTTTYHHVPKQG